MHMASVPAYTILTIGHSINPFQSREKQNWETRVSDMLWKSWRSQLLSSYSIQSIQSIHSN
jgi:hypothetical protein